jgi:hypothetical protein
MDTVGNAVGEQAVVGKETELIHKLNVVEKNRINKNILLESLH